MQRTLTQGFSLIWALILSAVLMAVTVSLVQIAGRSVRTSGSIARGTLLSVSEQNVLSYSRRLLEANAARLVDALPAPTDSPAPLTAFLQGSVDTWCNRDPDGGGGGRLRVYFTATSCGVARPSDAPLPAATLTPLEGGTVRADFPFVIVAPTAGRSTIRSGTLTAFFGAAPVTSYSLLVPDDLILDGRVSVNGNVHVDGHLTVQQRAQIDGLLSVSNCNVATPLCTGRPEVTVGTSSATVMQLLPSPARPAWSSGQVALGQRGETGAATPGQLVGLTITASDIALGVLGDGSQYIHACSYGVVCLDYVADAQGNLYQGDNQQLLTSHWTGVVNVVSPGGPITLRPQQPDGPSINLPLSVNTTAPVILTGNLTYDLTSCAGNVCSAGGDSQLFSVSAPSIRATAQVQRVHGTLVTNTFTNEGNMTLFGSLDGHPAGSAPLLIQQDARALRGLAAPSVPRLVAQWRGATINASR
ncbi:hypothetical protein [Deinococcus ruber]|uniref:Uncharacterized protein n=1 Tax=Deinococcus ruber TaxID=1848197 RepID=A0A918F7J4_9DEIO|nr:hypothetical protein [Deinococcus ruber]GGR12711.1 hypothetical protein GCM10008957_27040 [Deinococcus ruber]